MAADVIWQKGFDDARMSDISDAVDLVKGALYHYVPSKERLLYEIIKEAFGESRGAMRTIVESETLPLDKLAELIATHIEIEHDHHIAHLVRVRDLRRLPTYLQDELHGIRDECLSIFVTILREGRDAGLFARDVDLKTQSLVLLHWLQALTDWRSLAPHVGVRRMALTQAAAVVTAIATDEAVSRMDGIEGLRSHITGTPR